MFIPVLDKVCVVSSDGHGIAHPHGITGTGVTGTGTGLIFISRGKPAPVSRVCGFGFS